jgi:hypothetical protein
MLASSGASELPASGLFLDPKGEFKDTVIKLARKYGREQDVVIFSATDWPQHGRTLRAIAYNPLHSTADGLELAAQLEAAAGARAPGNGRSQSARNPGRS